MDNTNKQLVESLLAVAASTDWDLISTADDVEVRKMTLSPDFQVAGNPIAEEARFAVVMAKAVLDASPEQVFSYFMDNKRVHEYNEYCAQVEDLEYLDAQTKISWSCSGPIAGGAISARDFVTRSHYSALDDGTLVIANRAEEHDKAPPSDAYVRMKMIWGGNIFRAYDRNQTLLTTITHINPGGVGETRFGSLFLNATAASGPRRFMNGLRTCIELDRQERTRSDSLASSGTSESSADTEESLAFNQSVSSQGWGSWLWRAGDGAGILRNGAAEGAVECRHGETAQEALFVAKLHEQLAAWQRRVANCTCTL